MTEAILMSFNILIFIFLGSLTGGLAVTVFSKVFKKDYFYLYVFCGGILAGILGFDLVPELMTSYRPIGIAAGISLGIFFMLLMDKMLHNSKHTYIKDSETFMMLFLALLFHSIPSGLALGINFQNGHFQNLTLLSAILIHHIPEGMVMMVSVFYSQMRIVTFWMFCLVLSLAVGINTYLGMTLDIQSIKLQTIFMGVAIGTLGYVTFYEVLWKGLKKHFTLKMLIVALLGTIFFRTYLLLSPFNH